MKIHPSDKRQTFYLDSIDIKPMNNFVLIKPVLRNKDRQTKSGIYVIAEDYADQPNHIDRIATVVRLPDKLYFNESKKWVTDKGMKPIKDKTGVYKNVFKTTNRKVYSKETISMDWDTDIELKEGDQVLIVYLEAIGCPEIIHKGEKYYLIKYEDIIAYKREGSITPINGYIICEKVNKKNESDLEFGEKIDDRFLKIRFKSKPVRKYFGGHYENDEIKEEDIVMKIDEQLKPDTEYYYHSEFFGEQKEFVYLQRRYFAAVI